jgi:hypothetical protein
LGACWEGCDRLAAFKIWKFLDLDKLPHRTRSARSTRARAHGTRQRLRERRRHRATSLLDHGQKLHRDCKQKNRSMRADKRELSHALLNLRRHRAQLIWRRFEQLLHSKEQPPP